MRRDLFCASLLPLLALLGFISLPQVAAQDGWLFSASPPIVTRYEAHESAFHFTNTSDKPVHGVTLHTTKDGEARSRVIIDTIAAHETVSVRVGSDPTILTDIVLGASLTCVDYSKASKIKYP